jgi:imidazolonepropionase-like amidohydrolase
VPGKRADVVGQRGNPLEDIHATHDVEFVMRDGVVHVRSERPSAVPASASRAR